MLREQISYERNHHKKLILGVSSIDNFSNDSAPTIMITTDQVFS